ncbi:MAG: hypothetical protein V4539_12220 [Bacteroidota bacterium]
MKKTTLAIFFLASCFLAKAQSSQSQQSVSPDEICGATLDFLGQLSSGGYGKFLGSVSYQSDASAVFKVREFNSVEKFPMAQKTIIVDTNSFVRYRSAKALMFSETTSSDQLSKNAIGYFNAMGKILDACLTPKKYEADYSQQVVKMHEIKMAYKYEMPREKSLFSNLQSGNTLVLEMYIDKKQNKDATYTYDFYLHFKRL